VPFGKGNQYYLLSNHARDGLGIIKLKKKGRGEKVGFALGLGGVKEHTLDKVVVRWR